MKSPERILVWLLRVSGAITLTALGAVFMPYEWMNMIHQRLGMGELPHIPIVGYLTRSVSALYALHGALLIFVSLDVHRNLPIVRFLGVAGVVMGVLLFGLDRAVEMPSQWANREGPFVVAISVVILVLAWRVKRNTPLSIPSMRVRMNRAAPLLCASLLPLCRPGKRTSDGIDPK